MWIFGYGSLIWKPNFDFQDKTPGLLRGFERRFYQGSPDHRGTPDDPGRVVTLLSAEEALTWGMAYRVEGDVAARILERLDHREKGGYQRHELPLVDPDDPDKTLIERALVYVATPDNPHYLGYAEPRAIARHVAASTGPSGPNRDYVLRLAESLRRHGVHDPHVFAIEAALHEFLTS